MKIWCGNSVDMNNSQIKSTLSTHILVLKIQDRKGKWDFIDQGPTFNTITKSVVFERKTTI